MPPAAETIDDATDPRIADYAHVGDPAWLRARGLFVAEGRLVVERLLLAGRFEPQSILLTPAACRALGDALGAAPCPIYLADTAVLERLTGFHFHQGCLALAARGPETDAHALTSSARLLLAMEKVGNPDNVGGLFRVARAFGADGVLHDPGSGDPLYRKSIRTSMGAAVQLPFACMRAWPGDLGAHRDRCLIVALTPRISALPLDAFVRTLRSAGGARRLLPSARQDRRLERTPLALLVGAEGDGLSDAAMDMAHACVRIPLAPGVDSLNVVVAAGIALAALANVSRSPSRGALPRDLPRRRASQSIPRRSG